MLILNTPPHPEYPIFLTANLMYRWFSLRGGGLFKNCMAGLALLRLGFEATYEVKLKGLGLRFKGFGCRVKGFRV